MKACLGGTFSPIHKGHEKFLEKAFSIADKVLIGLTTDEFANKPGVQPYEKRKKDLEEFLKDKNWLQRAEIEPISNAYGPAIEREDLGTIVVSSETRGVAEDINAIRIERKLKPLKIVEIPMVLAENGKPISATRIRAGEIDRNGKLLHKP